jgi:hypothetical protein
LRKFVFQPCGTFDFPGFVVQTFFLFSLAPSTRKALVFWENLILRIFCIEVIVVRPILFEVDEAFAGWKGQTWNEGVKPGRRNGCRTNPFP